MEGEEEDEEEEEEDDEEMEGDGAIDLASSEAVDKANALLSVIRQAKADGAQEEKGGHDDGPQSLP